MPARLDVIVVLASAVFTIAAGAFVAAKIIWTFVSPETLAALLGV